MIKYVFFCSLNMPPRTFKVATPDRVERSLSSGTDIEELLFDACLNLDITQNTSCQVCIIFHYV